MSDALRSNNAEEAELIRGQGLAQGRRKFSAGADDFPLQSAVVVNALKFVYDHDEQARDQQLSAAARLLYPQTSSAPVFTPLKTGLEQQTAPRRVEPHRSVGKALAYLLDHGDTLPRVGQEPGAPLDNNTAERALKLAIRQRKNSLFSATAQSASLASVRTSGMATWVQAGGNALDYLVAVPEQRQAVFATPSAWLPWNSQAALAPA